MKTENADWGWVGSSQVVESEWWDYAEWYSEEEETVKRIERNSWKIFPISKVDLNSWELTW